MELFFLALLILVFIAAFRHFKKKLHKHREYLIQTYVFPDSIKESIIKKYPHVSPEQAGGVVEGLREYFQVCNAAGKSMVSMPSQVVDVAWHEFILFTRKYQHFCNRALGHYLHHTPAEAMKSQTLAQDGIKLAWKICCQRENINPKHPQKLPLLFALDTHLQIPDGFYYSLDCSKDDKHCAGHIGCSGGCGGGGGGCSGGGGCGGGCGGG